MNWYDADVQRAGNKRPKAKASPEAVGREQFEEYQEDVEENDTCGGEKGAVERSMGMLALKGAATHRIIIVGPHGFDVTVRVIYAR